MSDETHQARKAAKEIFPIGSPETNQAQREAYNIILAAIARSHEPSAQPQRSEFWDKPPSKQPTAASKIRRGEQPQRSEPIEPNPALRGTSASGTLAGIHSDEYKVRNEQPPATDECRLDWLLNWLGENDTDLPIRDWEDNRDARRAIDEATSGVGLTRSGEAVEAERCQDQAEPRNTAPPSCPQCYQNDCVCSSDETLPDNPATDDKEWWTRNGCEIIRQGCVIFTCDTEADAVHAEEMHNGALPPATDDKPRLTDEDYDSLVQDAMLWRRWKPITEAAPRGKQEWVIFGEGSTYSVKCGDEVIVDQLTFPQANLICVAHNATEREPATDDRVKEQGSHAEWTREFVENLMLKSQLVDQPAFGTVIADAHNAALTAEREKVKRTEANADKWFDEAEGNNNSYEQCVSAKHKIEQQLLQAQAAIAEHNREQYPAFRAIDVDLSALDKHTEEAVAEWKRAHKAVSGLADGAISRRLEAEAKLKPLVDALERLRDRIKQAHGLPNFSSIEIALIDDALAKVKEGKS
jgi:hypothetical protein